MVIIPKYATDKDVLTVIRHWLDVLAREDYASFCAALGFAAPLAEEVEYMRWNIKNYRSPEYYPEVEDFTVSDWRTARGGNPNPLQLIRWYEPTKSLPLVCSVELHLPLNCKWSDLEADFVLFEASDPTLGYALSLEGIEQPMRE